MEERFTNEDQNHAFVSTAHASPTLLGVPLTGTDIIGALCYVFLLIPNQSQTVPGWVPSGKVTEGLSEVNIHLESHEIAHLFAMLLRRDKLKRAVPWAHSVAFAIWCIELYQNPHTTYRNNV